MTKTSTKTRKVRISARTRELWANRDKSQDDSEIPSLPPEQWAKGVIGKYYKPMKTAISLRIDNDVLAWLRAQGTGHLSRINDILREEMIRSSRAK